MKQYLNLILGASAALFISSCTTQMYVANTVNAPLLKEKGEVQVSVTQSDIQAALAVTDHIGIMANGFYKNYKDGNYQHNGVLGELGVGYFKPLDNNFVFETFAGGGIAHIYQQKEFNGLNNDVVLGKFNADAMKIFLQPDFGYRSKIFDAIISSRFSMVKYSNFSSQNYPTETLKDDYLDNNNLTGPTFLFAEPALTCRVGYKYVKLQGQVGLTINLTGDNIKHASNFSSLGIIIDIAKWYDN